MSQQPSITVSIRLSEAEATYLDEYRIFLRRRRHTPVSRSDLMRLALATLALPKDAHPELQAAHAALTV